MHFAECLSLLRVWAVLTKSAESKINRKWSVQLVILCLLIFNSISSLVFIKISDTWTDFTNVYFAWGEKGSGGLSTYNCMSQTIDFEKCILRPWFPLWTVRSEVFPREGMSCYPMEHSFSVCSIIACGLLIDNQKRPEKFAIFETLKSFQKSPQSSLDQSDIMT